MRNKTLEQMDFLRPYDFESMKPLLGNGNSESSAYILGIDIKENSIARTIKNYRGEQREISIKFPGTFGNVYSLACDEEGSLNFSSKQNSGIMFDTTLGGKLTSRFKSSLKDYLHPFSSHQKELSSTEKSRRLRKRKGLYFKGPNGRLPLLFAVKEERKYSLRHTLLIKRHIMNVGLNYKLKNNFFDLYDFIVERNPNENEIGRFWDYCIGESQESKK